LNEILALTVDDQQSEQIQSHSLTPVFMVQNSGRPPILD